MKTKEQFFEEFGKVEEAYREYHGLGAIRISTLEPPYGKNVILYYEDGIGEGERCQSDEDTYYYDDYYLQYRWNCRVVPTLWKPLE